MQRAFTPWAQASVLLPHSLILNKRLALFPGRTGQFDLRAQVAEG
jgi:hypothetical protein